MQADDVLTRLKNTNSHATRNILKLRQSMLDEASSRAATSSTMFFQPSSLGMAPSQVQDAPPGLQAFARQADIRFPSPSSTQKLPSKAKLLAAQSRSMPSIACNMEEQTEGKEALLSLKMDIEMEKKKLHKFPTSSVQRIWVPSLRMNSSRR